MDVELQTSPGLYKSNDCACSLLIFCPLGNMVKLTIDMKLNSADFDLIRLQKAIDLDQVKLQSVTKCQCQY